MFNGLKKRLLGAQILAIGFCWLGLAIISGFFPTNIFAQNNPFGAAPGQPDAGVLGQPADAAGGTPIAEENNLIIRQLLLEDPSSPLELANAIRLCVQLGRTDVARKFIKTFATTMPSPQECSTIQRSLNSAFLYEIATHPKLQPDGDAFVKTIREGAIKYLRDDARILQLINNLGSDDGFVRRQAASELRTCDINAAVALGVALGDPAHEAYYDNIETALAGMGNVAVEPIIGFLSVEDEKYKARIISVLGKLGATRIADRIVALAVNTPAASPVSDAAQQALTEIVGVVPTKGEAAEYLEQQFERYLKGDLMLPQDRAGRLILWTYDVEQKTVVPELRDARTISLVYAASTARNLYSLDPENSEYKRLFLRSELDSSKVLNGMNKPLADQSKALIIQESPRYVLSLLEHCLETKHYPAAVGAAEVLGEIGDESLLYSSSGKPTRIIQALNSPNRRVRFAIADAIFKISPRRPFAGSSYVASAAAYFIQTTGIRKTVVGDVKLQRSLKWGGLLSQTGFISDQATTGQELIKLAQKNADYEFIILSEAIQKPGLTDTVYTLRNDPRTADIPIGIIIDDIPNLDLEFARVVQNSVTGKDENGFFKNPVLHRAEIATNPAYKLRTIKYRIGSLEPVAAKNDDQPLPSIEGNRDRSRAQRLADVDPLTFAMFDPNTPDEMLFQTQPLRKVMTYRAVSTEERLDQARRSLEWFNVVLDDPSNYGFYNPVRHQEPIINALFFPMLCTPAMDALVNIPTREAQLALLSIANQNTQTMDSRNLAAAAFSKHVQNYRMLLTRDEITQQYNLYNKNIDGLQEELDLLGKLLDAIELPTSPVDGSEE